MNFLEQNKARLTDDISASRSRPEGTAAGMRVRNVFAIPVNQIESDPQHREHFDQSELQSLASSLKTDGQLQPIRVRREGEGYKIIAGERRWRAAKLACLETIDCVVVSNTTPLSDSDILREQILNSLRSDLLPTERARAFRDFIELEGITAAALASRLHLDRSVVSRYLGLLDCPPEIQEQVDRGTLPIKKAIAKTKPNVAKSKKARPTRQQKIRTSLGLIITITARKYLKESDIQAALQEALSQLDKAA